MKTTALKTGDKVCRRSCRTKIVGTVERVYSTGRVLVKWDGTATGWTGHRGHHSRLNAVELVLSDEFVSRPLSAPPEDAWRATLVQVIHHDGSGVHEYGRNIWNYSPEGEASALEHGKRLASEGEAVSVSRQEVARWVPEGCQAERAKYRWIRLLKSEATT